MKILGLKFIACLMITMGCGNSIEVPANESLADTEADAEINAVGFAATQTNVSYKIPSSISGTSCNDPLKVAQCINTLVENKKSNERLTITILPGTFVFDDTVLIFQRDDVIITGSSDWLGRRLTTIKLADTLKDSQGSRVLQYFHFNIIDSNGISILSMNLDGNSSFLTAERGIAVCPLANGHLRKFDFRRLQVRNYLGFFTLIGNSHAEHLRSTFLRQSPSTPAEVRLKDHLENNLVDGDRFCSGTVSDVRFESNDLFLKNVGFYVVPFAGKITSGVALNVPFASQQVPGSRDWLEVHMTDISAKQTGYVVKSNNFTVDLPANTPQSVQETAPHSAIKVHGCSGMILESNKIDAGPLPYVFGSGAAINLAAGMFDTKILKNTIKFSSTHRYPQNGIFVHAGHATHSVYGIGDIALFAADLRTSIQSNQFINSKVRIWDACVNAPGKVKTDLFCKDMVSTPGKPKSDGIIIRGNRLQNASGKNVSSPDKALTWLLCTDEAAFVARLNAEHAGYVVCRKADVSY